MAADARSVRRRHAPPAEAWVDGGGSRPETENACYGSVRSTFTHSTCIWNVPDCLSASMKNSPLIWLRSAGSPAAPVKSIAWVGCGRVRWQAARPGHVLGIIRAVAATRAATKAAFEMVGGREDQEAVLDGVVGRAGIGLRGGLWARHKKLFFGPWQPLDRHLPLQGCRLRLLGLAGGQLHREPAAGVFRRPASSVGQQPLGKVVGDAGVKRTVSAAQKVDEPT